MKNIIAFFVILLSLGSANAQKLLTRTGHIWFFSETPAENIEAHNHQAVSILNKENGELVFQVLMKGFEFEKALMQEHFNEKYVESDKFPKASFKGKIDNFDKLDWSDDDEKIVQVSGELTIHGVTQQVKAEGTLSGSGNSLTAKSEFKIKLEDYQIKIPAMVQKNIAEEISIHVDMAYKPM